MLNEATILLNRFLCLCNLKAQLPWGDSRNEVGFFVSISALQVCVSTPENVNILLHCIHYNNDLNKGMSLVEIDDH